MGWTLSRDARGVSAPMGVALMTVIVASLGVVVLPSIHMAGQSAPTEAPSASFGVSYEPDASTVKGDDGFEAPANDAADRLEFHNVGEEAMATANLVVRVGGDRVGNVSPLSGGSTLRVGGSFVISEADSGPTGSLDEADDRLFQAGETITVIWDPAEGNASVIFRGTVPETAG